MKKTLSLFLVLTLALILATACVKKQNTATFSGKSPVVFEKPPVFSSEASASAPLTENKTAKEILNYVVVQRGQDKLRVGFNNDSSDQLRTLGIYGLVPDVEKLVWLASRGGAGIDSMGEEKTITELPVVQESENNTPQDGNLWFYDGVSSKNVWIRLNYQPFIPSQGMNVWGHKDLIVYIDPQNHDNAYLGIQNTINYSSWDIILLPGYGPWLAKEMDMLLRLTIAM